jgi:ribosomal protein S18 acetylase RimI-like enzyme
MGILSGQMEVSVGDLVIGIVLFLAVWALCFDPLAHGPGCAEKLTEEEEELLGDWPG